MKITSVKVDTDGVFDHVCIYVDGEPVGTLCADAGEGEKLASLLRVQTMASGAEPHWLVKDFNVLYRCASAVVVPGNVHEFGVAAVEALKFQLDRLKPAFTDTEEVREWMRQRG